MSFNRAFNELVSELARFPGVGKRSAERMAFHVLKMKPEAIKDLTAKMEEIHNHIKPCSLCNNFSTKDICAICASNNRQRDTICIVEEPKDIMAIEKTSRYNGLYYVLLGAISPVEGINPEDLSLQKLLNRLKSGEIKEVIISTDPDNDGELTAQFLIQRLSSYNLKIYRIAIGIPLGTKLNILIRQL